MRHVNQDPSLVSAYVPADPTSWDRSFSKLRKHRRPRGLRYFRRTDGCGFDVEFSSKILGQESIALLNRENITVALGVLKDIRFVNFDIEQSILKGTCSRVDVVRDVAVDRSPREYFESVQHFIDQSRYRFDKYTIESIVLMSREVSKNERLIVYDKRNEIAKKNRMQLELWEDLFGKRTVLRFEQNIRGKDEILSKMGVATTSLRSVLDATASPHLDTFRRALICGERPTPPPQFSKNDDMVKYFGHISVLERIGFDFDQLAKYLRTSFGTSNTKKQLDAYRKSYAEHLAAGNQDHWSIVQEFADLMN